MRPVATLSSRGFLTSILDKANEEMLNFYLCHHDQPELFVVNAPPLSRLLQEYGSDPHEFSSQIQMSLRIWLAHSFDVVEVDTSLEDANASATKVQIGVIVGEVGKTYQLNHLLLTEGTRMIEVLNSNGDAIVSTQR